MDPKEFTEHAKTNHQINLLLTEVAQAISSQVSIDEPQHYSLGGTDIIIGIAAYALYRWLKDYFVHRRALNEQEILRQREPVIAALIHDGFEPDKASIVVNTLLENIAKRSANDPALQIANNIIRSKN